MITLSTNKILVAISKLDSQEAIRTASESMSILTTLVNKHVRDNIDFAQGDYDVAPCGPQMTLCNNAFFHLADRMEDILSTQWIL